MPNKAPANWEEKTLGDILDKGSSNLSANKLNNCDGIYPVYGAGGLVKKINFYQQEQEYLAIIKDGAGVGRVYHYEPKTSILGTLQYLFPKKNVNIRFAYYYLQSIDFKKYYQGAAIPHIYYKDYTFEQLILPPLSEQERIMRILDEVFENIENAKQNTIKNLNNAKELFESHLNTLLCYFEINGKYKHLSELTTVKDGTHESPKYVKIGIPFITQKNIKNNGLIFITQDTKYISEEDHSKFYQRSNVEQGDILISMIGANRGMACLVDIKNIFSIKNVGLIKSNSNINMKYLLYFFKSKFAKKYIDTKSKGGAQEFISLTSLRNFPILYVDIKDQEYIVQQLDRTKENIQKLEQIYSQKIKDLDELKQSILQKAFNGEL